jgi:hypothetical protein
MFRKYKVRRKKNMTKVVINKKNFKVNGGKEFELPIMTVKKHREMLEEMRDEKDKMTNQEYTMEMQRRMVFKALQSVDDTVTMKAIEQNIHPTEFNELADAVWEAGRDPDDDKSFRIGEKK